MLQMEMLQRCQSTLDSGTKLTGLLSASTVRSLMTLFSKGLPRSANWQSSHQRRTFCLGALLRRNAQGHSPQ